MYNPLNRYAIAFSMLGILIMMGCSDSRDSSIEVGEEESKAGFGLPQNLQPAVLPTDGQLKAYFVVDNNPRMAMQFDGQQAQITISNLSPGTHTFRIEFEFEYLDTALSPIMLATAEIRRELKPGTNNLNFDSAYEYPDSDGDSIRNYTELEEGTDPMDSTCLFGQIWNGCTPAATPIPNPA